MKKKDIVLIVEDDRSISKMLEFALAQEGYKSLVADTLKHAADLLQLNKPDVILLDLGLPDGDGKGFIKLVRSDYLIPIIVVSARSDEKEIVTCLDMGADDYVTKPLSTYELLARLRSAQRRLFGFMPTNNRMSCNEITLDTKEHIVYKSGGMVKLTPIEFNLLKYFLSNRNQVLTHSRLLKEVWGIGYQHEMQYLRTYINSLRKKIEDDSTRPRYIVTEMKIGYRFFCTDDEINSKD
ncbi:response regulator [bacterium]|nr:response regulator [bacterium]